MNLGYTWYPKDFISDPEVMMMSPAQRGVYRDLIDLAYMNNNQIKYTFEQLCKYTGADEDLLQSVIDMKIIRVENNYHIPSCEARLNLIRGGRKGGKNSTKNKPTLKPTPKPTPNQKEKEKEKEIEKERKVIDPFSLKIEDEENEITGGLELFQDSIRKKIEKEDNYIWEDFDSHNVKAIYLKIFELLDRNKKKLSDDSLFKNFARIWERSRSDDFHSKNLNLRYFDKHFNKLIKIKDETNKPSNSTKTEPSRWDRSTEVIRT